MRYLVRGVLNNNFIAAFFSEVRKVPARLLGAGAAVVMTESGIKLVYDVDYFEKATDEHIELVLCHELFHVLNLHFLRGKEIATELGIGMSEFARRYVPLADAPVNNSLQSMSSYSESKENMLTYDSLPDNVSYDEYPTYESLVRHFHDKYPPEEEIMIALQFSGDGESDGGEKNSQEGQEGVKPRIVKVNADGSSEVVQEGDKGAPVITIPEVDYEDLREHMKGVKDLVQSVSKKAGNAPWQIRQQLDDFLDKYDERVLKGWKLIQYFLSGYRTIDKGRKRTFSRLNRRTGLLPGRIRQKGFRVLFIIDESGSMSDEEVSTGLGLVRRTVMRENSDKLYYMHWDTEPASQVEEIKNESDIDNIKREKAGGTNFSTMFRHKLVLEQDVDLYVILTDGYPYGGEREGWPDSDPIIPQVWIITEKGGYEEYQKSYHRGVATCIQD